VQSVNCCAAARKLARGAEGNPTPAAGRRCPVSQNRDAPRDPPFLTSQRVPLPCFDPCVFAVDFDTHYANSTPR
jgi:hypothetical protein